MTVGWFRRHREPEPEAAPAAQREPAEVVPVHRDWAGLPPVERFTAVDPTVVSRRFEESLLSWRSPIVLRELDHALSPDGPPGMVFARAAPPAPPVQRSAAPPVPAAPPSLSQPRFTTVTAEPPRRPEPPAAVTTWTLPHVELVDAPVDPDPVPEPSPAVFEPASPEGSATTAASEIETMPWIQRLGEPPPDPRPTPRRLGLGAPIAVAGIEWPTSSESPIDAPAPTTGAAVPVAPTTAATVSAAPTTAATVPVASFRPHRPPPPSTSSATAASPTAASGPAPPVSTQRDPGPAPSSPAPRLPTLGAAAVPEPPPLDSRHRSGRLATNSVPSSADGDDSVPIQSELDSRDIDVVVPLTGAEPLVRTHTDEGDGGPDMQADPVDRSASSRRPVWRDVVTPTASSPGASEVIGLSSPTAPDAVPTVEADMPAPPPEFGAETAPILGDRPPLVPTADDGGDASVEPEVDASPPLLRPTAETTPIAQRTIEPGPDAGPDRPPVAPLAGQAPTLPTTLAAAGAALPPASDPTGTAPVSTPDAPTATPRPAVPRSTDSGRSSVPASHPPLHLEGRAPREPEAVTPALFRTAQEADSPVAVSTPSGELASPPATRLAGPAFPTLPVVAPTAAATRAAQPVGRPPVPVVARLPLVGDRAPTPVLASPASGPSLILDAASGAEPAPPAVLADRQPTGPARPAQPTTMPTNWGDAGSIAIESGVAQREADGSVVFTAALAEGLAGGGTAAVQRESDGAAPTGSSTTTTPAPSAPAPKATTTQDPGELDELAKRLYGRLRVMLKHELRLDRERAGSLIGSRR